MSAVALHLQPDPDDPDLWLPYVDVVVAGVARRALLDTGAARSSFGVAGLDHLDAARAPSGAGAFGGTTEVSRARVPISLGEREALVVTADLVPADHPGPRDLVGQDILSHFRCDYRPSAGTMVLDGPPAPTRQPLLMDERQHVYLTLDWPGPDARASAVFDTGAAVTVVDAGFHALHPRLFTRGRPSTGTDATGAQVSAQLVTMSGPVIGGRAFDDSVAAVVDLSAANEGLTHRMDLILGWPLIAHADWCIDHPGGSWGFAS